MAERIWEYPLTRMEPSVYRIEETGYGTLSEQWKKLEEWIDQRQSRLFDVLLDQYILFGEWCYATHSVYYGRLSDYFIGFDVYDKETSRFLWKNMPGGREFDKIVHDSIFSETCRASRIPHHLEKTVAIF